jgi:4-aminobutyrate aminotransferase
MSAAKALQVGMSAYLEEFDPGGQGVLSSTWGGGSRIDMAVGARIIKTVKQDRLLDNASRMGEKLKRGLLDLASKEKCGIIDARGLGLMIGIEFESEARRDAGLKSAFEKGLLLLPAGQKSMRVIPPLVVREEELEEGLALMEDAFVSN